MLIQDDMDYHYNNAKCRKIEQMMPRPNKMVEREMEGMRHERNKRNRYI